MSFAMFVSFVLIIYRCDDGRAAAPFKYWFHHASSLSARTAKTTHRPFGEIDGAPTVWMR